MERAKKEPIWEAFGMPMMGGLNLPQIELPNFNGSIMNWLIFWEQFQAAIYDDPHMGDVDKLTYLWDAIKGRPSLYLIQELTQLAESYGETIKCLNDCYDRTRATCHEHI